MPANQAKVAISETPRTVLLKAQARKTYKGVLAPPRLIPPVGDGDGNELNQDEEIYSEGEGEIEKNARTSVPAKRPAEQEEGAGSAKRQKKQS